MDRYLNEDEQVERLKEWWNEYGNTIMTTLFIVIIAYVSWHWWQGRREKIRANASTLYQQMLVSVNDKDAIGITARANELVKQYPRTVYAQLASMTLASQAVEKNQFVKASERLHWVLSRTGKNEFRQIAYIRLARVLKAENKLQEALSELNKVDNKSFYSLVEQTRGDIYVALGKESKARQAYQNAIKSSPAMVANKTLLEMKLHNLPATDNHVADKNSGVVV